MLTNNDITRSLHTWLFLRSIPERCILEALLRRVLYCGHSAQYSHLVPRRSDLLGISVTLLCIVQSKNSTYVKATQHQSVLNFDSTKFLFPNSKVFGMLRKSVQTIVICRHSWTSTSWHFDARLSLEALSCHLPKSFVFNRCRH